jgi:large subunit ribosomal protein L9
MKVILQQNVQKLGKAGDIVDASDGYFRNFLQPRKLAVVATNGTLKKREEDIAVLRKRADAAHAEYVALADEITAIGTLRIFTKTGEGGKLYGKVTTKEVGILLEKTLGKEVDKRLIKTDDMNALGTYKAIVKLAPDVQATINVEVHPEGTESQFDQKASHAKAAEAKAAPAKEPEEVAEEEAESES